MPSVIRHLSMTTMIVATLLLSACNQPAQDPKAVAENYWKLLQTENIMEAEKLATIDSRRNINDHAARTKAAKALTTDDASAIVTTTITTINPETGIERSENFDTVLVLEQGQWKVAIDQTIIPPQPTAKEEELQQLAEDLSESMQENINSLDEAMNQGMHMLNDALRDGSKEMGDSLLNMMNELNRSMKESVDKLKKRREEQNDRLQRQPDPDKGEGMI